MGEAFGFTGEWQDPNDLLFLRARYYNPAQAAFLSLDPLEGGVQDVRTLNRYGYVQANPVNYLDPSGLMFEEPPIGCGGGFPGQADECVRGVNNVLIEPLGTAETILYALSGLKLTVSCGSRVSWMPYLKSVQQAIRDVEAKIGNFRDVFG